MRWYWMAGISLGCSLVLFLQSRSTTPPSPPPPDPMTTETASEPIQPIPLRLEIDRDKARLGRKLFHDTRLSRDNSVSCSTCHDLRSGGVDGKAHSVGIDKADGSVNAPAVLNSGFNFKQFWDGRAATLEEQIDGPTHNPNEMGSSWPEILDKLRRSAEYNSEFRALYPDGIQPRNIKDAIATFERSLYTPNARFDRYLRGDDQALTDTEKEGYRIFKSYGCVSCHQGVGVGGNMFQTFGVMADYFADRGHVTKADFGRYNVTGDEHDRYVFKVPSLRNVALTSPYFHDGSAARLEDAVVIMGKYQLGRELSEAEVELIVEFLGTLTGECTACP